MESTDSLQDIEQKLQETMEILEQNNVDAAFEIIQELISSEKTSINNEQLDKIYMGYYNISIYYQRNGQNKKAIKIIGDIYSYLEPLFKANSEKYIHWYASTLKSIALIFEQSNNIDKAIDMFEYIWAICYKTNNKEETLRAINDLCRVKAMKGEIDFCLKEFANLEKEFDLYGAQKNKMADTVHIYAQCLNTYGVVLWQHTNKIWEAYRILTKAYCAMLAITQIPYTQDNNEFSEDLDRIIRILQQLDKELNTNIIIHAMETVVTYGECSGVFLLTKCGLFGDLQKQCIERMISDKVIEQKTNRKYNVLMKTLDELHQSVK